MPTIRLKSTIGLPALTGTYILLVVLYLVVFSGRYDALDSEQAEIHFKATLYASYSFPAFVLVLWLFNGSLEKPASIPILVTLATIAFLSIYLAGKFVMGL